MKKTVIVNINGIIFHVDEDAYEKLSIYLDTLKRYFNTANEGKEIIEDIEARIVELMQPKISEAKQSISIEDIGEIIGILGNPEDIAGGAESSHEKQGYSAYQEPADHTKGARRLHRDVDHSVIGGVCSGLGAYFNVDPVIFRIIFIALIFAGGVSLIIYPVLWIAVPAAITSAQKLEMRGRDVNISNIERQVRDEYARVKNNISQIDTRSYGGKINNFFHEIFRALGNVIMAFGTFLKFIFAITFILAALGIIVGVVAGFYFNSFAIHEPLLSSFSSLQEMISSIVDHFTGGLLLVLALIIVALPCAALIYWGLKLMIRFKANDKYVSLGLSIVWLGTIITFAAIMFNQFKNFKYESTSSEVVQLQKTSRNILYIEATGIANEDNVFRYHNVDDEMFGIDRKNGKSEIISPVTIYLEKATGNEPYIEIEKKGRGASYAEATQTLKSVSVYTNQADTVLTIDPFFRLRAGERWKFNRTKVIIHLPEGMNIHFSPNIEPFVNDIRERYWYDNDVSSEVWQMTATGIDINQQKIVEGQVLSPFGNKMLMIKMSDKFPISQTELTNNRETRTITYKRFGRSYTVTYDSRDNDAQTISFNGKNYKYGIVSMDIEKSTTNDIKIDVIKTLSGTDPKKAAQLAEKIEFGFVQKDSVLMIDPIYLIPETEKIKKHKISIKLYIPEGRKFYMENALNPLYNDNYWLGKPLQMNENGNLERIY
ncbi:MAG TPA: PspC domain-containing protein [Bacteroidales bacterium]|nr:PspC domain-containing protein [Bacteroidales bacterium]